MFGFNSVGFCVQGLRLRVWGLYVSLADYLLSLCHCIHLHITFPIESEANQHYWRQIRPLHPQFYDTAILQVDWIYNNRAIWNFSPVVWIQSLQPPGFCVQGFKILGFKVYVSPADYVLLLKLFTMPIHSPPSYLLTRILGKSALLAI